MHAGLCSNTVYLQQLVIACYIFACLLLRPTLLSRDFPSIVVVHCFKFYAVSIPDRNVAEKFAQRNSVLCSDRLDGLYYASKQKSIICKFIGSKFVTRARPLIFAREC